jgi:hypothetical protein
MTLEGNYQHAITANPATTEPTGHLPFNQNPFFTPIPPAHDDLFTAIHLGVQDTQTQADPYTNQFDVFGSPMLDSMGGLPADSKFAVTRDFLGTGTDIFENDDDFGSEEKENMPPESIFSNLSARFSTQVSRNNKFVKKNQQNARRVLKDITPGSKTCCEQQNLWSNNFSTLKFENQQKRGELPSPEFG